MIRIAVVLVFVPMMAFAAPPPEGSDDAKIMGPYKEWATSQHDLAGRWCCDIGDGRPVEAVICQIEPRVMAVPNEPGCPLDANTPGAGDDRWWAHVTRKHFPDTGQICDGSPVEHGVRGGEPCRPLPPEGAWISIPDDKILRQANPTGVPILWLYQGRVQCFAPPDGT